MHLLLSLLCLSLLLLPSYSAVITTAIPFFNLNQFPSLSLSLN